MEHNRVYGVAVERKNLLSDALNAREVFQVGLDRVIVWLEDKEQKITKLEKHKLLANDVEKQTEKAKVSTKEFFNVLFCHNMPSLGGYMSNSASWMSAVGNH